MLHIQVSRSTISHLNFLRTLECIPSEFGNLSVFNFPNNLKLYLYSPQFDSALQVTFLKIVAVAWITLSSVNTETKKSLSFSAISLSSFSNCFIPLSSKCTIVSLAGFFHHIYEKTCLLFVLMLYPDAWSHFANGHTHMHRRKKQEFCSILKTNEKMR